MKTHFGETLSHLMQMEKLTQNALAESSGIDRPSISQYINGELAPSRTRLPLIVRAISSDRARRIALLMAHLRDEAAAGAAGAGFDERHYMISPTPDADPNMVAVPFGLVSDFQLLAEECAAHADVRELLQQFAQMIMRHRAEISDETGNLRTAEPPPGLDVVDRAILKKQSELSQTHADQIPPKRPGRR